MNFGQCVSEEWATEMGYGCCYDVEPGNYITLMQLSHYTRRSYYLYMLYKFGVNFTFC